MTIGELLAGAPLPAREARALAAHAIGAAREWLIAHPDAAVTEGQRAAFAALVARRQRGEPMAYLLGVQEFYGRPFAVDRAVLIPRPETEGLVDAVLQIVRPVSAPRILDLGTGSGCIAITLALERPDAIVTAADRSVAAIAVARANTQRLGARVTFVQSDWYQGIDGVFEVIVANPPYVAGNDPHLTALRDEPLEALTDQADGLTHLRSIAVGAPARLASGGWLVVEHGFEQGAAVRDLFETAGLHDVRTRRDAAGLERVCIGRNALISAA